MMTMKRVLVCIFLLMGVAAHSQYYHTPFGQNRIQYQRFEWAYYATENFEVYYYPGGKEYALDALTYLESEFVKLTDILGYAPYTKTKIFIYNSVDDLQQSNIGIGGEVYTIGGKTDFVKLQVEIAYPGTSVQFKKEIVQNLSYILINDMMFGGSLAEIFQNSYLLTLPTWFIEGAANYLAYGWSPEMDDYIRDYLSRKNITHLVKVQDENAALIGQSIWNYIAVRYGKSNISNILNLTRIIRNEENSIASTLGIQYKTFLKDWQAYYSDQRDEIAESYQEDRKEEKMASYPNREVTISHVSQNTSGTRIAYTAHHNGKHEVLSVDLETGKEVRVYSGGYHINNQKTDENLPLIDWQDENTLGILLYKRGNLYLNTYNLETGERLQRPLPQFRQVRSFKFNDNGKLAILSADVDGQNDLFLISMRRTAVKRITNDMYDDTDPTFIPGSAAIVFSSNRTSDSVKIKDVELRQVGSIYNLFMFNLDTTTHKFMRLTNTFSVDRHPIAKNAYTIYYLSDQKGIDNIFRYNLHDSTFHQVTNYNFTVQDYDMSFEKGQVSFIMLDNGRTKVFYDPSFNLDNRIFTPQTARMRLEQARFVMNRFPQKEKPSEVIEKPEDEEEIKFLMDSLLSPDDFVFEGLSDTLDLPERTIDQEQVSDEKPEITESTPEEKGFIDTDNYVFEDEEKSQVYRPESFFSTYKKFEKKSRTIGPIPYEPRFSFGNLVTSFGIDPIRDFCFLIETEINDVLENHRFTGGVLAARNLSSGDVYGEYRFLKYWMDFHLRFDSKSYVKERLNEENLVQKYVLNKVEFGAQLPITHMVRLEAAPFIARTEFRNLQGDVIINNPTSTAGFARDSQVPYTGGRAAIVIDNTIEREFNIYQGTRGLVEYENFIGVGMTEKNFSRINVDLRHYQKIHRELTLAGKLYFGRSMGNNRQSYLLGGVSDWFFNTRENQGSNDPLNFQNTRDNTNILFAKFVNLRGYDYNEAFGSNTLAFNGELRFPVFRYFSKGPISSNFLRNFQMIGFYDIGTVWNGTFPYKTGKGTLVKTYEVSQFGAEIQTFQNPWLASYGMGLRTVLLGYYVKVDVARPIHDFQVGATRVYVSIGLDF